MKASRVRTLTLPVVSSCVAANDDGFNVAEEPLASVSIWSEPGQWRAHVDATADLCEVMSSVEDLWLRMARHPAIKCAVLTGQEGHGRVLIFRVATESANPEVQEFMRLAASSMTYLWSEDGAKGNLVASIEWCAEALMIEIVPTHQIRQWPSGESTHWQMLAMMQRMQVLTAIEKRNKMGGDCDI